MPKVFTLDQMPLTNSNKIDRVTLKGMYEHSEMYDEPANQAELVDSMGVKRKVADPWVSLEMQVIRDLYVFGCCGIYIAHWLMYDKGNVWYSASINYPTQIVMGAFGKNLWHSQIFSVLNGYTDAMYDEHLPGKF